MTLFLPERSCLCSHTIYFDLETSSLSDQCDIIQLAAIAVEDPTLREVESFQLKIDFDASLADQKALAINHYDSAVWASEAVKPQEASRQFASFLEPYKCVSLVSQAGRPYSVAKLAGFNAVSFDGPRLFNWFQRQGRFLQADRRVRCVLQRVLWYFDERGLALENYKQPTVAAYFGLSTEGAHEALADVRTMIEIVRCLRWNNYELAKEEIRKAEI